MGLFGLWGVVPWSRHYTPNLPLNLPCFLLKLDLCPLQLSCLEEVPLISWFPGLR